MSISQADIQSRFTYHPPKGDAADRHEAIREGCKQLALLIVELVPGSREQSGSIHHLDLCMMEANAGIARHLSAHRTEGDSE